MQNDQRSPCCGQAVSTISNDRQAILGNQYRYDIYQTVVHKMFFRQSMILWAGIFESYLQLGEHLMGPEAGQTTAAFQLKMAQAMQRQVEKRIRPKVKLLPPPENSLTNEDDSL